MSNETRTEGPAQTPGLVRYAQPFNDGLDRFGGIVLRYYPGEGIRESHDWRQEPDPDPECLWSYWLTEFADLFDAAYEEELLARLGLSRNDGWHLAVFEGDLPEAVDAPTRTPEPQVCYTGDAVQVYGQQYILADCDSQDSARRLAASWNACAGIPTAALEGGAVAELVEAARLILARLDLEAEDTFADFPCRASRHDLRAALARLEG